MSRFSVKDHKGLSCFLLISVIISLGLAVMRESSTLVHAFDTGIYVQVLTSFMNHGDFFSSITSETNFMAHHFQPIILILLPFYYFWQTTLVFFFASIASNLFSVYLFIKLFYKNFENKKFVFSAFIISIFWHQSVFGRTYYGFVPEIFALPCFIYHGYLLAEKNINWKKHLKWLAFSLLIAGLCKENIWIINFFTCALLGFKHQKNRTTLLILSALNIGFFLFLFLYWMPKHTNMPSYYGMRYFMNPAVTDGGKVGLIKSMFHNLFSLRSFTTFFFVGLTTGFFAFLGFSYALLGALPGVMLILVAYSSQVHHFGNHYPLLFLGFLWAAGATNVKHSKLLNLKPVIRYLSIALVITCLYFSVLSPKEGALDIAVVTAKNPHVFAIKKRLQKIKSTIPVENFILADASQVTELAKTHRNVKVLLGFVGNPTTNTKDDFDKTQHVITSVNFRTFEGGCEKIAPPKKSQGLAYHYSSFYDYCHWITSNQMEYEDYKESKISHFYYKPN